VFKKRQLKRKQEESYFLPKKDAIGNNRKYCPLSKGRFRRGVLTVYMMGRGGVQHIFGG